MSYRLLLSILLASHWPVWLWYFRRMSDGSDEPWGIVALATCLAFVPWKKIKDPVPSILLLAVIVLQALFLLLSESWVPILRALFVVLTLGIVLVQLKAPTGIMGLLALSLPWIATLQFYLGFPLRVFTGEITKWLLFLTGFDVQREGIVLLWNTQQVVIDRPCAGIYMLWFGAYLAYLLASYYKLNLRRCLLLGMSTFALILVTNILRNFALFFLETGIVDAPDFVHEGVGIILFLIAVGLLTKFAERNTHTIMPGRALRSAD